MGIRVSPTRKAASSIAQLGCTYNNAWSMGKNQELEVQQENYAGK